ncbi:MAG: NADH-quinone oxidoreductase subunit I, partial [Nitrospira sp.]|nr:NADH-quinone oxidoreductase subunit I [Nitrospira sp.]
MTVRDIVKRFTFIEILKGMALTLRRLFSRAVTIQYPRERRHIAPGFRGQHALAKNPEGKA